MRVAIDGRRGAAWRAMLFAAALAAGLVVLLWLPASSSFGALAEGSGGGTPETSPPADIPDPIGTTDFSSVVAPDESFQELEAIAIDEGSVRAIVTLQVTFTPEGLLTGEAARAQRGQIARARAELISAIAHTEHAVVHEYASVPSVALVLSVEALQALQESGLAAQVQEDALDVALLASAGPIVESTEAAVLTRTGSGRRVAVLDTGADKDHAFIGSSQVSNEACFARGEDGLTGAGNCPNGLSSMVGAGAAEDYCTMSPAPSGCDHGTHVAGIAMGGPHSSSPGGGAGIARSARLIPVQVFSIFTTSGACFPSAPPCVLAFNSDQLAGLEYIFNLPTSVRNTVAAVNMSIGGGIFSSACDGDARKPAIDNLISVGIATAIASGNNGSNTGVSAPGCISTAVTVGATTDADAVAAFSNSSSLVDLLAIGVSVTSSVPNADPPPAGAPPYATFQGTSMATPMVAGAFAVLDQVTSTASVSTHLARLQTTGVPVTDPDNGVTKPRIRVLAASVEHRDTGFKSGGTFTGAGFNTVSNGAGLATRAGGPSASTISISGIPSGATKRNAFLYWTTIGGPDTTAVFNGVSRTGTLVGASRDTCWFVNGLTPNRVYRASIPLSSLTASGNGAYTVSGVGGVSGIDGQGASLLIVYSTSSTLTGKVHLRHGAMSVNTFGATMSHTFTSLSLPSAPVSAHENLGIGDGQSFGEGPKLFAGSAVTGSNWLSGVDGPMWDDHTIPIPLGLLPAGTTSRTNSITTVDDCLVWSYAALQYLRP